MSEGTRSRLQKIEYARRITITTAEDKICAKGRNYDSKKNMCGGTRLQFQKIKYARRDVITTPEDKICPEDAITTPEDKIYVEERDYNSSG